MILTPRYALFSLLFLFSLNSSADPFYADSDSTQQAVEFAEKNANFSSKSTACIPQTAQRISLASPFNNLKAVGIVQFGDQFRAIFSDEQQHLIDLKLGDLIEPELIEIHHITLKSVQYIDWQRSPTCTQPTIITLKF